MTEAPKFVVILEKKGRGRGITLVRPWAVRTFKLSGQNFEYYDGDKLKGTLDTNGAKIKKMLPSEADNKEFPFLLDTGKEKVMLNASSDDIRGKCMEFLLLSSTNKNWSIPVAEVAVVLPIPEPLTQKELELEVKEKECEEAQSAAVVGILTSGVEVARLEEENRKLEEDRKRQVEEATASAMADELAKLKLRQAADAEAKQKEEQERQVMELLKGMGAKTRFKAALKAGKRDVAVEAGACMVQGSWRAKCARRRMLVKKAQKEALRLEGCARKIQSRYRSRLARKRMDKIKEERVQNKRKIAVLKAQCVWRIYCARKKFKAKQQAKLEAEFGKSVTKQRAFIRVQKMARAFIARKRVGGLRVAFPSVLVVKVNSVEGLNGGDGEPFAFVSGMVLALPADHDALINPRLPVTDDVIKAAGQVTSIFRTPVIAEAASGSSALAVALSAMQYVVVTIVDKDTEFLGQVCIRLSDYSKLDQSAAPLELTLPLQNYLVKISDDKGDSVATVRRATTGTVTLTISRPSPAASMCGWLWKVSESLLSSAWKRRWFILINGQLQYFNTDVSLEQPKNVVNTKDVTGVTLEVYKGRSCIKIAYRADGTETFWMVDFDENESPEIRAMWLRKIRCACPALVLAELIEPVRAKLEARGISIRREDSVGASAATGGALSPMAGKARVPVSKRMSVFGR